MKYYSTRSAKSPVSFEHVVLEGLAPDGGLYIPTEIPSVSESTISKWSKLSFSELAVEIFSLYVDPAEVPREDLVKLANASYSTFRTEEVTPVRPLGDHHLLELFHGPTYAFKDVALQFVGNLFEYFLVRKNGDKPEAERDTLTVIGATSGDTGSAAIYGLRGKKDVSVFILYPQGRVSPIQEQQMTTILDANVHTITVPGTFDDCQDFVKACFSDKEFNDKYHVGAVNSINWARILAQITYYFKAYFALGQERPRFVVPTGNFGDILAGFYAQKMGLPIDLVIATNQNDILYRFIESGKYEKNAVHASLSPAMDIAVSSNFERFLWYAAREHLSSDAEAGAQVAEWMNSLKSDGKFSVPETVHKTACAHFGAAHTTDKETTSTIKDVFERLQYILDPHTAVAFHAAQQLKGTSIVLSTAHPAKFGEAVDEALKGLEGYDFDKDVLPDEFKAMMTAETKKIEAPSTEVSDIQKIIIDKLNS